jgi:DMATS type aromatic prenyltransferase
MAQTVYEESPELQFGCDQLAFKGHSTDLERQKHDTRITRYPELSIWQRVNSELDSFESVHHRFWWTRHTGKALAIFLYHARYPADVQYRNLEFFVEVVAPHLGISLELVESGTPIWPSFMTDDGTPVEISWDWGTTDAPPTIRYSVEPIGLHAGTSVDPGNLTAGPAFQEQLARSLPMMRLEWFHHFQAFFGIPIVNEGEFHEDTRDHNSSIFYAFDCSETDITPKVYFFPKSRAKASGQSNLDVLFQAMRTAPHVTEGNFKAGDILHAFCASVGSNLLEHEMLAIDLIDPLRSRLKMYFRCRETTFNSVINIMALGGRIRNPKLYEGLVDLHRLWTALFGVSAVDQPLRAVEHRTSGILYNVEFRLGEALPVAKIYLPVRHYSASDEAVIRGLNDYFKGRQKGKYMDDYIKAMSTLL